MAAEIGRLDVPPLLAILDGTNAACGIHGWDVSINNSVGLYRAMFVHPLTKVGAAVLSLGHPPKAVNRQNESYSYGAAGWLNDVDGVGYKLTASKTPISKGAKGSSALYVSQRQVRRGSAMGRATGRRRHALVVHGAIRRR